MKADQTVLPAFRDDYVHFECNVKYSFFVKAITISLFYFAYLYCEAGLLTLCEAEHALKCQKSIMSGCIWP